MEVEKFDFHPAIIQLRNLILNKTYSDTDENIFFRHLINDASDAVGRVQYESLLDKTKLGKQAELFIHVKPDDTNNTLTILDSGIGMTKDDLLSKMNTIDDNSGIQEYIDALAAGTADLSKIGKFGVSFYSVYLVAHKVIVTTKHDNDLQYVWDSQDGGSFTITTDVLGEKLGRGTKTTLYLKQEAFVYLEKSRLNDLIETHIDPLPIKPLLKPLVYLPAYSTTRAATSLVDSELKVANAEKRAEDAAKKLEMAEKILEESKKGFEYEKLARELCKKLCSTI